MKRKPVLPPTYLFTRAAGRSPDRRPSRGAIQPAEGDDYPLYTMQYHAGRPGSLQHLPSRPAATNDSLRRQASQRLQRFQPPDVDTPNPAWACSLFAALGDTENRLFGRNFDWRYSPRCCS